MPAVGTRFPHGPGECVHRPQSVGRPQSGSDGGEHRRAMGVGVLSPCNAGRGDRAMISRRVGNRGLLRWVPLAWLAVGPGLSTAGAAEPAHPDLSGIWTM